MANPNWKKGVSGNPGGRPKAAIDVQALAREHTPRAIARLAEIMESEDEVAAAKASAILLDRAWGKPAQSVDVTGNIVMGSVLQKIRRDSPKP